MSRRVVYGTGLAAAAGVGYYLYTAGGDPKVAQKEVEHDLASAKASLKGERISGQEAKKAGEEWAQRAGSKIDSTASQAESKLDQLKYDSAAQYDKTKQEAKQSIDKFDKTVEKKAAEAKSGISSWFGFGGK